MRSELPVERDLSFKERLVHEWGVAVHVRFHLYMSRGVGISQK